MIEQLEFDEVGHIPPTLVIRRLNEVIEAVNQDRIWLEQHSKTLNILAGNQSQQHTISHSSGLRPLHIEDGQVQDDVTLKAMHDNQLRYQTPPHQAIVTSLTPSVPEAEPPEQERFPRAIWDAIWELTNASATVALATKDQSTPEDRILALLERRDKAQLAIIAAAHREYAQPHVKDGEAATIDVWVEGSRPTQSDDSAYWRGYLDGQNVRLSPIESPLPGQAAQPGKGG